MPLILLDYVQQLGEIISPEVCQSSNGQRKYSTPYNVVLMLTEGKK